MRVRALISFTGIVAMRKGEERELADKRVLKDLLNCKYVEEVEEKKTTRKGVKKDENQ